MPQAGTVSGLTRTRLGCQPFQTREREIPEQTVALAKLGSFDMPPEHHGLMPKGETLEGQRRASLEERPEEGENETREHESLPDEALSEGPGGKSGSMRFCYDNLSLAMGRRIY